MNIQNLLAKLSSVRETGPNRWQCQCPAHDDARASLSIKCEGGKILLHCHAKCSYEAVIAKIGVTSKDLSPDSDRPEEKEYKYYDSDGNHVYSVLRFPDKKFRQKRTDGTWSMKGVQRVPYNFPEVLKAKTVYIVEGEKDVETLRRHGLVATTNAGGAGKWSPDWKPYFKDKRIFILPDNDRPGFDHAADVKSKLGHGLIIYLPDLPPKGDVSDWFQAGGTLNEFLRLIDNAETSINIGNEVVLSPDSSLSNFEVRAPSHYRPFPIDTLPVALAEYIRQFGRSIPCDPAFVAMPLLAGLAACVGNSLNLRIKRTWTVPPLLWLAVVAPSGSAKSVAPKQTLRPLFARQSNLIKKFEQEYADYLKLLEEYQKELTEYRRNKESCDPPDPPKEPVCPRIIVSDTTIEALGKRLADNPRGVLATYDELAGWLGAFNRYSKGAGSEAKWLEFYSAQTAIIDRSSDVRPLVIERASVSLFGTIQPEILRKHLTAEYKASGLAARLLFAMPPRQQKEWSDFEVDEAVEEAITKIFESLLSIEMPIGEDGGVSPQIISLDTSARDLFIRYFNRHNREQAALDDDLYAAYSKLEEVAARLALIVHAVRFVTSETKSLFVLDLQSMAIGIELCEWFKNEAKRVYGVLNQNQLDQDDLKQIQWISRQGKPVTPRDFHRGCKATLPTVELAEQKLQAFVERGLGKWHKCLSTDLGGRPTRRFELANGDTTGAISEVRGGYVPA